MNLHLDVEVIFLIVGIVLGLSTAIVLFLSKQNRAANSILGLLALVFTGALTHNLLLDGGIYEQKPDLYFLPVIARLAIGPLLWLYTLLVTGKHLKPIYLILLFCPVALELGTYIYGFQLTLDEKFAFWGNTFGPFIRPLENWLGNILLAVFLVFSFLRLRQWNKLIESQRSEISKLSKVWLFRVLMAFTALFVVMCVWEFLPDDWCKDSIVSPTDLIRTLLIVLMAWFGIRQNRVELVSSLDVEQPQPISTSTEIQSESTEKIATDIVPVVTEGTRFDEPVFLKIQQTIGEQKLFLDAELTIFKLASACQLPTKLVSYTINQGTGKTFLAFVNKYRVEEVCRRLAAGDQKQLTLLAIAFESGFNSKSTFNRVFRECTGVSPSDYKPSFQ
ncbi:MAG: helix-turn-helix domain-containing protein [Bacteroidia bacterium]